MWQNEIFLARYFDEVKTVWACNVLWEVGQARSNVSLTQRRQEGPRDSLAWLSVAFLAAWREYNESDRVRLAYKVTGSQRLDQKSRGRQS